MTAALLCGHFDRLHAARLRTMGGSPEANQSGNRLSGRDSTAQNSSTYLRSSVEAGRHRQQQKPCIGDYYEENVRLDWLEDDAHGYS